MEQSSAETSSPAVMADDDALLCPACGYDLRGSPSERCSECGMVIDRIALAQSGFPWARRKEIGRLQAYLTTVWLVTLGSKRLAHEASKPQDLAGARRFQTITASVVAAVFIGVLTAFIIAEEGLGFLAVPLEASARGVLPQRWLQDLVVPWSAGATMTIMMPLMCIAAAIHLAVCQGRVIVASAHAPRRRERARAIACYASAPLTWLLPVSTMGLPLFWAYHDLQGPLMVGEIPLIAFIWLLVAAAGLGTLVRTGQYAARVRHAGLLRGALAAVHLVGWWLLGLVVLLGLVPWCIGFLWIAIDSFR